MEKTIYREERAKHPIGQTHRPITMSEYEVSDEVAYQLKRMGMKDMLD